MAGGRFSVEAVFKALDRFSRPVTKMQESLNRFTKSARLGIGELNSVVDGLAGGLVKLGVAASAVGLAGGAALFNIGKAGSDFDQAMANVGAVSLMTRAQVQDLEKEARKLGLTTKFTATEVANGMELMGKAGFENADILKGIGPILSAAAAEGADFAETAGNISAVLKGMGLSVQNDTQRVADVLTLASARTNSSITSLGESMKNLAPVARQFKVPLEEAVASVALLQDVGMDASEAGTAMATMLTKLAKPTDDVVAQMRAMNITFQDAKGNMLPLSQVLANFGKASNKAGGNMKQVAFFADLVGLRGQKAALNLQDLAKKGDVTKLVAGLRGATGSAAEMANLRMDTFEGDLRLLGNAVEDVKISLFDLEKGPLRDVAKGTREWVMANKDVVISGVQAFIHDVRDNLPKIVQWGERFGKIVTVFGGLALAIKGVAAATWLWDAALAANPFTLWILALTAAVALVWAFWPEISAFFGKVWGGAKDLWARVVAYVTGLASSVVAWIRQAWQPVKAFLVGALEFVVGLLSILFYPQIQMFKLLFRVIAQVASWVMQAWEPVKAFFAAVGSAILQALTWIWDVIVQAASFAWGKLVAFATAALETVKAIWAPIGAFFSALWDGIAAAFKTALGWVIDKIGWAVDAVRKIGRSTMGTETPEDLAGDSGGTGVAGDGVITGDAGVRREIRESNTTSRGEVTIRDESGKASITKAPKGGGFGLTLATSDGF